jgi:hypothetical protein
MGCLILDGRPPCACQDLQAVPHRPGGPIPFPRWGNGNLRHLRDRDYLRVASAMRVSAPRSKSWSARSGRSRPSEPVKRKN